MNQLQRELLRVLASAEQTLMERLDPDENLTEADARVLMWRFPARLREEFLTQATSDVVVRDLLLQEVGLRP